MHITPEAVEAAYNLLLTTPPFNRWKLPEADDVEFHVIGHKDRYGDHDFVKGHHCVRVSFRTLTTIGRLLETLAHEMIHMREKALGVPAKTKHGPIFQKLADQVCKHHTFDRGAF